MPILPAVADLLTTVTPETDPAKRWLATRAAVKLACKIVTDENDLLIDDLIRRVSGLIDGACKLATDAVGTIPTLARETLEAAWREGCHWRGGELVLPWRVPVTEIVSIVENGVTLTPITDYVQSGAKPGRVYRMSTGRPACWSGLSIVVRFKAGFALPAGVDPKLETACIEQVKAMLHAAPRDPALRSLVTGEVGSESYSQAGGDTVKGVLLPQVLDAIAPFINPLP